MRRLKKTVLLVAVLGLLVVPTAAGAITGLSGPVFGLGTAPNGDLLVADGTDGVLTLRNDTVTSTRPATGLTDVAAIGHGTAWATRGTVADPTTDNGQALYRISEGSTELVVNLFEFEATVNPDGNDPPDSNPYAVLAEQGRSALVADAGGNALLRVDNRGDVDVLAVFPDELVSTDNLKALAGCPDAPPDLAFACGLPPQVPAQAVPTSIARGADGWLYVGELKGFPAPTDASNIWKVAPDADWAECGSSPDCVKVFDGGFTSVIDLVFGDDGTLYVAELDEASWLAIEFQLPGALGGTINACDVDAVSCDVVTSGVPILTALAIDGDGALWATRNALIPGMAEVFAVE
jgi:hypothetical protein